MKTCLSPLLVAVMLVQCVSTVRVKRGLPNDIWAVLNEVLSDVDMSQRAVANTVVRDVFDHITGEALSLARRSEKTVVTQLEVESAVRGVVPEQMVTEALNKGDEALQRLLVYNPSLQGHDFPSAGLLLPVSHVERYLATGSTYSFFTHKAAVYMTAVLECLMNNVQELVSDIIIGNQASQAGDKPGTPAPSSAGTHDQRPGLEETSGSEGKTFNNTYGTVV